MAKPWPVASASSIAVMMTPMPAEERAVTRSMSTAVSDLGDGLVNLLLEVGEGVAVDRPRDREDEPVVLVAARLMSSCGHSIALLSFITKRVMSSSCRLSVKARKSSIAPVSGDLGGARGRACPWTERRRRSLPKRSPRRFSLSRMPSVAADEGRASWVEGELARLQEGRDVLHEAEDLALALDLDEGVEARRVHEEDRGHAAVDVV